MQKPLSAKRPYLLRAYYDWIVDNQLTPYLLVDATYYGVNVPTEYVQDGQIILNLSMRATNNLHLGENAIEFCARFNGQERQIYVPMGAALAIYARENGEGAMFEAEQLYLEQNQPQAEKPAKEENSFLRIVK